MILCIPGKGASQGAGYRDRGYKGSISYTNMILAWNGLDTSHGYMFNEHHYLGGGLGAYLVPSDVFPTIVHLYADYHAYWFDKKSTPTAGIKVGYARSVNPSDTRPLSSVEIEPNIGWSWGLKSGNGLTLSIGARMFVGPSTQIGGYSGFMIAPVLSFAFEF